MKYANIFSIRGSPNPTSTTAPTDSQGITSISPTSTFGNDVTGGMTIIGTNFLPGITVKLTKSTKPDILPRDCQLESATKIKCFFTIPKGSFGKWSVVATNTDGTIRTLQDGFDVRF